MFSEAVDLLEQTGFKPSPNVIGNEAIRTIAYELLAFHGTIVYCLRAVASYWSKIDKFLYPT